MFTCERCGCDFTPKHWRRAARFCSRSCANSASARRGEASRFYKGGVDIGFNVGMGRWVIYCRDGTQMTYYRGLMAGHIGRLLRADEIVHHINGDPTDDRLENLEITTRAEHARMHMPEILAGRGLA